MCCGFDNDYIHDCENGVQPTSDDNKRIVKKLIMLMGFAIILAGFIVVLSFFALITR